MPRSTLHVGSVRHRRMSNPRHEFEYPVWYALLDLDELEELSSGVRFFSHNRFNLVGFDDRDHMGTAAEPVRDKLDRWMRSQGAQASPAHVILLTHLRILGHVFNPVSFFFCLDEEHRLQQVVAEVNNTFGETYCYLLEADGTVIRHEEDKVFHVSPFQPVDGRYRFRVTSPGPRMTAHIDVLRDGERVFDSTLRTNQRPLTGASLLKTVARYPHTGLRTLALIHFQALRLFLKRAKFYSKPEPPVGAWRTRNG